MKEKTEPEFPGGSVSLKSQLVRREISSCMFIHSNQVSVDQVLAGGGVWGAATLGRNEGAKLDRAAL